MKLFSPDLVKKSRRERTTWLILGAVIMLLSLFMILLYLPEIGLHPSQIHIWFGKPGVPRGILAIMLGLLFLIAGVQILVNLKRTAESSKGRRCSEIFSETVKARNTLVDAIKIIFDFLVIGVMVWAILVALAANDTAREGNQLALKALHGSYIPWLSIHNISISNESHNAFTINYSIKNSSQTAALRLKVDTVIFDETPRRIKIYEHVAIMPGEEGDMSTTCWTANADKKLQQIYDGNVAIRFTVRYWNAFGDEFILHQHVRYQQGTFSGIRYDIDGIDKFM